MISRLAAAALAVAALTAAPRGAAADLFQWTDADGVVRYTNDLATIPPAFRDQARDVGSPRVREAPPAPAPAAPGAGADGADTVIPFRAGAPIVTVARLNGTDVTLMLDTGADRTVISPAAIARAGYGAEAGRAVTIVGVAGSAAAREISVPVLDVAGRRIGPLSVIVHDVATGGLDGLLGRDVLDYFTLTVDAAGGRAVLSPR